ncbi:MAG: ABC transporter substrate-binding protein [bacterium]|nr:ABC transporter substrate-binding protein [bacterium]
MSHELIDARGRSIPLQDYLRVVSLVPSLSETVLELGRNLIGRTPYCIHPRSLIRSVPEFGGPQDPHLENILAASPDLILASVEENRATDLDALENAGVAVFAVDPHSIDDVMILLRDFGLLLGAEAAAADAGVALKQALVATAALRDKRNGRPGAIELRATTLVWRDPWIAAGGDTYIEAVMRELGLVNLFADRAGYPHTTLPELVRLAPDLVLLPDEPQPFGDEDVRELYGAGIAQETSSILLVPGEALCWYGTRTARALTGLVDLVSP